MLTLLALDAPQWPGAPPEIKALERDGRGPDVQWIDASAASSTAASVDASSEALASADVILTLSRDVDAAMIARARCCWMILIYGPALRADAPRIDLEAARAAGIYVASSPDFASAELARRSWEWITRGRQALGHGAPRIGIVGLGAVGRQVVQLARAERFEPWVCDPLVDNETFNSLGVRRAPLEELLGMAPIVALHVARTTATRMLLDGPRLALLGSHSWLINASSPNVIDLAAVPLDRRKPAAIVWPGPPPVAPAGLKFHEDHLLAGHPQDYAESCRQAAGFVVALAARGGRPPHLLIDPPCPRHALRFNGQNQ